MVSVLTVIGARPQFIKAAIVSRALRSREGAREILVHTGQHFDPGMSDVFFEELGIPSPSHHLGIGSASHGVQTGRMLAALEDVMRQEDPDWVLIYGDTNSTLAGALAAAKLQIPVAHVEAGLRSFNRSMPEEVNRVVADHLSARLYAPTRAAIENLSREGISGESVLRVGDVMYDAALFYGERAAECSAVLNELGLDRKGFVLATVHRASNTDDPERLRVIMESLMELAGTLPVVFPIHPRTRGSLARDGRLAVLEERLQVIEPVGYLDMVMLERSARLIVTDSGGVQKEAFFHGVPCVTLREETEWTELVDLGWNRLASPTEAPRLMDAFSAALHSAVPDPSAEAPYGSGDAAAQIAADLTSVRGERR